MSYRTLNERCFHPSVGQGNPYSVKTEFHFWRDFYLVPRSDLAEPVTAMNEEYHVVYCQAKTFAGKLHPFALHGNHDTVIAEFQIWGVVYHAPRPNIAELVAAMNGGYHVVYCHAM